MIDIGYQKKGAAFCGAPFFIALHRREFGGQVSAERKASQGVDRFRMPSETSFSGPDTAKTAEGRDKRQRTAFFDSPASCFHLLSDNGKIAAVLISVVS